MLFLVDYINKRNYVWMLEAFEDFDLVLQGSFEIRWHVQRNLFDSIVFGKVHLSETTLPNDLLKLILFGPTFSNSFDHKKLLNAKLAN